jgi:hypothetical protein
LEAKVAPTDHHEALAGLGAAGREDLHRQVRALFFLVEAVFDN